MRTPGRAKAERVQPSRCDLGWIAAFSEFPAEALRQLAEAGQIRTFEAGARLIRQGEEARGLFALLNGRARVQRSHPSLSVPLVLAELGVGEVVGEMGIFDRAPRSATVIAMETVVALELDAEALLATVADVPGMAGALLRLVSRRLRNMDELVEHAIARFQIEHELILRSVDEGIWLLGSDGPVTFANASAARMLDRPVEDLAGHSLHELVHPNCSDDACPFGASLAAHAERRGIDEALTRSNGSKFPVEYTVLPLVDRGAFLGTVVTIRDITERRAAEREKEEFISTVSHELRTPLTSIRGSLGLLASGQLGQLPEKARRMVEIADTNTGRLVRLINDLLDIERMESGHVTMKRVETDAGELMRQAADLMRPMAEKAGVRLIVDPVVASLVADPDRILQTLSNLLSNAIKFSPRGGRVWLEGLQNGDAIEVRVRDEGRGIPADKQGLVFERFQQVHASDAREKGGTGLGLPICRGIVEQHGGTIWVESQWGQGSTFAFALPCPTRVVVDGADDSVLPLFQAVAPRSWSSLPVLPGLHGDTVQWATAPGAA